MNENTKKKEQGLSVIRPSSKYRHIEFSLSVVTTIFLIIAAATLFYAYKVVVTQIMASSNKL